jgi:hypothetical protein
MEFAFILAAFLLIGFAILGIYDGFYLHIFKYRLYEHSESKFEHLTHTIRAILFPFIFYFLCLENSLTGFYIGIILVIFDIIILGIDAYVEKDSRAFMGGLPRWEYIIHLFANGFHFALISVILVLKVSFTNGQFVFIQHFDGIAAYHVFILLIKNILPGAFILAILHIVVSLKSTAIYWNRLRNKISCC